MARMQFGTSAFERARGDLPELPVVNLFLEEAPTEETGIALQSRPGLEDLGSAMGAGPVETLFQRDGVLSGTLFGISAGQLYAASVPLGTVVGGGVVSIAGNEVGIMATAGGVMRFWDGTTLSDIAFPDGAGVRHVATGASRFYAVREDTGKVYWTAALGDDFDALDFATAESLPDDVLHILWLDDGAILLGEQSIEFWPNSGDADLPIQPLEGAVITRGIKATGCATLYGETWACVGDDNVVYLGNGTQIEPISNAGLEERIKASAVTRLWAFFIDGEEFLALTVDAGTYDRGGRGQRWSQFASYGETNWIPHCYADGVFGSSTDGTTMAFTAAHEDLGGVLERRVRAGFALNSGGLFVDNLILRCNVGQTPFTTGDYATPSVEMRTSDDAGQTWSAWDSATLGAQGDYRAQPVWDALGMASQPGFLVEFRVTAPIDFRVSDVLINEPRGGR